MFFGVSGSIAGGTMLTLPVHPVGHVLGMWKSDCG